MRWVLPVVGLVALLMVFLLDQSSATDWIVALLWVAVALVDLARVAESFEIEDPDRDQSASRTEESEWP